MLKYGRIFMKKEIVKARKKLIAFLDDECQNCEFCSDCSYKAECNSFGCLEGSTSSPSISERYAYAVEILLNL